MDIQNLIQRGITMKKYISVIMVCVLIAIGIVPGYAQTIDNAAYGMSFELSDSWTQISTGSDNTLLYSHLTYPDTIMIEVYEANPPIPVEMISEESLDEVFRESYSVESIESNIKSANNGIDVAVEVIGENSDFAVTYQGNTVYVYQFAYVARAEGYEDMHEQVCYYYLVENGKRYFITHITDSEGYGVRDVIDMVNSMTFANDYIEIYIDEEQVFPDSAPILVNNRTLVPIRAIAEYMGYKVDWDGGSQKVIITDGDTTLEFTIGSDVAYKNSTEEIKLDVPAVIYSDRTYLPLRAVAEALEADVKWDGEEKAVNIRWKMALAE